MKNKIPLRKCIGCGDRFPKNELIRVVRTSKSEEPVSILLSNEYTDGRGAYLCRDSECLKKARKAKRLERAFSCKIDSVIYDSLERLVCESER